jgi:lysyl endopeptidase
MRIRFIVLAILVAQVAFGQLSKGGLPPSKRTDSQAFFAQKTLPKRQLPPLDLAAIRAEDDQQAEQARFAAPILTDISPQNSGTWATLPDGTQVWRCAVGADGALGLVLLFDQFRLPVGAELFAYAANGSRTLGAYTAESCHPSGMFTIGVLPGTESILELTLPAGIPQQMAQIHLNRVDYAYHRGALADGDPWAASDFGNSLGCHVNINCPEAAAMQTEKKGIARILMVFGNGSAWCSGSLMANTSGSGDPLFLTAHHCQILLNAPQFAQWAFHFDYESPTCANPATEPTFKSVLGCERLAFRAETDMMLLRLSPIPFSYGLHFNGWSRSTQPAPTSTFIHHPQGDIKKFSADNQVAVSHPQSINWGAGFGISQPNTHWKVVPDVGIYEPGSSGCPMFDANKRVVGQLHGGISSACNVTAAYFGMFHLSWDQGNTPNARLRDWLDPTNLGSTTQNGYPQPAAPAAISGRLQGWWGPSLRNFRVAISGGSVDTVTTDTMGNFRFVNLPPNQNYTIKPLSPDDDLNGVTTFDLVKISQHILTIEPLGSPWRMLAADVNNSNTITSFDIIETRKTILGVTPSLPFDSWRFFSANAVFPNPNNPFETALPPSVLTVTNLQQDVSGINFYGVKTGDLNQNAFPEGQ